MFKKMKYSEMNHKQLTNEAVRLRQRISELEKSEKERNKTEKVLRQSEEKFASIFTSAGDGILFTDKKGRVLEVNPALSEMTGISKKEVEGKSIFVLARKLLKKKDVPRIIDKINRFIKGLPIEPFELEYGKKILEITAPNQNVLSGITAIFRDITDRKLTEKVIREERDNLQKYLEIAGVIFIVIDTKGEVTLINQKGCQVLGYKQEEIIGKDWFDHFLPENIKKEVRSIFRKLIQGNIEPVEYHENSVLTKEGYQRIIAWHNTLLKDDHGHVVGTLSSGEDITEKKMAEEALHESEVRYRTLFDHASDSIIIIDPDSGEIIDFNDRAHENLGYTRKEFKKIKISDMEVIESPKEIANHMMKVRREKSDIFETKHKTKNGEIKDILVSTKNIHIHGKDYIESILIDITDRKRAEKERQVHLQFFQNMDKIQRVIRETTDLEHMMYDVLGVVLSIFKCDRAWLLFPCDPDAPSWHIPMERTVPEYPGAKALEIEIPMKSQVADVIRAVLDSDSPVKFGPEAEHPLPQEEANRFKFVSQIAMAIYPKVGSPWMFGLHQCSYPRVWTKEEEVLFQEIGRRIGNSLTSLLTLRNLKESEERFRSGFRASAVGMMLADRNGRFLEVNQAMCKIMGYSRQELLSLTISDITFPADKKPCLDFHNQLWTGKVNNFHLEKRYIHKNQKVVWGDLTVSPIHDNNGEIIYTLGQLLDITENKKAEERVRELAKFPSENPSPIIRIAGDGIIVYANEASKPFLRTWKCQVGHILPEKWRQVIKEVLTSGLRKEVETECNDRIYSIVFAPVVDAFHVNMYGFDITERKQNKEQIKKELEEKEILLKEIHHRVKNNLQIIISLLNLQSLRIHNKDTQIAFEQSKNRIYSMALVHEQLYQSKNFSDIPIMKYIQTLVDELVKAYQISDRVKIATSIEDVVLGIDRAIPCGLILNELITNAIKHAFPQEKQGRINISFKRIKNKLHEIKVQDNGVGLPDRFDFKCNESLGLQMIKVLTEQIDGIVRIKRERGTVFIIKF